MFYLFAFLLAIPSPIIWILNAEAVAILGGLAGTRPWILVGTVLAAGQMVTFTTLYLGSDGLVKRFGWLRRKVEKVQSSPERLERYQAAAIKFLVLAALFGIPPLVAMSALSPAFKVRYRTFILIAFGGRLLRFCFLAGIPQIFSDWFPVDELPSWVLQIL